VLDPDAPAVRCRRQLAEGETQPDRVVSAVRSHTVGGITFEDLLASLPGNSGAVVLDDDPNAGRSARYLDCDVATARRVLDRVAHEVLDDATQQLRIALAHGWRGRTHLDVARRVERGERLGDVTRVPGDVGRRAVQGEA